MLISTFPLRTKYREVVVLLELEHSKSAMFEDFGSGDVLVEEMLDNSASDGGKEEFGGGGELVEFGD